MFLGGLVEGLSLALLIPLLASITGGDGPLQRWSNLLFSRIGTDSVLERLTVTVIIFIAAMAVRGVVLMARSRAITGLQARYIEYRRAALLRTLAEAPWRQVAGLRHARVTTALTSEIGRVALTANSMMQFALAAAMLAAQLALTLVIAWGMGLLALGLLAAAAFASVGRMRLAKRFGDNLRFASLKMVHTSGQLLGGLKQAAAENRQGAFVSDYEAAGTAMAEYQIEHERRSSRFHFVVSMTVATVGALVLLVGVWIGTDSVALIASMVVLSRMVGPAVGLQRDGEMIASTLPAHGMIVELEEELRNNAAVGPGSGESPEGVIRLDQVTYLHDNGERGVAGVTLAIAPGEVVGVTGASGAGKTTLIDLITGLLPPQQGTVSIGGQPLDDGSAWRWRNRIAYVAQDAYLTNDTIRRNIFPEEAGPVEEDVLWTALEQASIAETVRAMPDGLETVLAERGSRLSGGERQRIAIARAILRRPALLILDEATNAIDVPTERRILNTLANLDPAMSILIVAHRTESLTYCSRVLVMEEGRLIDDRPVSA
jgi:ATP-binding cassette subfamily C protein